MFWNNNGGEIMDINSYIEDLPSVEAASFDEYAKLMQLYILTAKKSDSFEGTKRLLTELYPDNAHFIYELLQNAEDAGAEYAKFEVSKDKLIFRHNGSKIFTLDDVKGITNIGNSTKKEDFTKVGKFGVGFKSVFAFTDTPRIYSKKFNFEIQDMLLPKHIEESVHRLPGETLFEFPFKGTQDEKSNYLNQIEKELKSLSSNVIMFLDNISRVEYILSDKEEGFVSKEEVSNQIYKIEVSATAEESYWLIFQKNLQENQTKDKLHVNIAFGLNKQNNKWNLIPVNGSVNIFFPAMMEKSGFRFNINGPFASTVARDSIRECEENTEIFNKIGELINEALFVIKEKEMMNANAYGVFPNNEDTLVGEYSHIRDKVFFAFLENSLLLGASGKYFKSSEIIKASPSIQDLFSFDEIKSVMNYPEKDWCCTWPIKNRNCRAFIESLTLRNFTYRTLSKVFDEEHRESFEKMICGKGLSWYRNLYLLIVDLNNYFQEEKLISQYSKIIENIKSTHIILNENGDLLCPNEAYLCNVETEASNDKFVNRRLIEFAELQIFWNLMSIGEFDSKASTNELLKGLEQAVFPSNEYLKSIAFLIKNANDTDFTTLGDRKLWFSSDNKKKYSIRELYLDKPYLNTGFSNIASIISKYGELSLTYYDWFKDNDLKEFIQFVVSLGIVTKFEIIKIDVKKNPLYHESLYKYSDNVTALSASEDYSIYGLEDLLKSKNNIISKMIWNYLISLQTLPRYCKASFSPNRTTAPRKCDSTLIQLLRDEAWVPNKSDGCFYKPADISEESLDDGFEWIEGAVFLNLIHFGIDKNRIKIQGEKLISEWGVDTESEQAIALRTLLLNPQMAGRFLNIVKKEDTKYNLTEAIIRQKRDIAGEVVDEDNDITSVRNSARRSQKIVEELENGLKKPASIKRLRLTARTSPTKEERVFLENQYHGKCQICGKKIKKWNGDFYFEGINLIDTKKLDESLKHSLEIGWNSLCLCPNHVAEYKYGAIDLSSIEKNIENAEVIDGDNREIPLEILMQGNPVNIMYSPKHFLALKTAFKFFKSKEK